MEISNAGKIEGLLYHRIMLVGQGGGGKSKLATTMPGRTFVYAFDPSALTAYEGCDWIDYRAYQPDLPDLTPYSLSKKENESIQRIGTPAPPRVYTDYAKDYNEMWNKSLYDPYDNVIMDSYTTFEAACMDAVMFNNGRYGKVPQQDDYPAAMALVIRNLRGLCGLPKNVIIIFHDYLVEDETTKKVLYSPMMIGKKTNKPRIPSYFNHLFRCSADQVRNKEQKLETQFLLQTTPSREVAGIRTAFQGLDPMHDVTIGDFSKAQEYGLGKILKEQK